MHKRGLCRHVVTVCVCVTFVPCVKTNKDIFNFFHRQVYAHHSGFSAPNGMAILRQEPPLTGHQMQVGCSLSTLCHIFSFIWQERHVQERYSTIHSTKTNLKRY